MGPWFEKLAHAGQLAWISVPSLGLAAAVFFALSPGSVAMTVAPENDGLETITGRYAGQGIVCPQFQLADGETVSLSNITEQDLMADKTLTLLGRWPGESKCMQGREFRVERVLRS